MGSGDRLRVGVDPRRHRQVALEGSQVLKEAVNWLEVADQIGRDWRVLAPVK